MTDPSAPVSPWYATVLTRVRELLPLNCQDGDYTVTLNHIPLVVCVKGGKIIRIGEGD